MEGLVFISATTLHHQFMDERSGKKKIINTMHSG